MKMKYYQDTDSLYIDLLEEPSVESVEVKAGVVIDFDKEGNVVGIDLDQASQFNMKKFEVIDFPSAQISVLPAIKAV